MPRPVIPSAVSSRVSAASAVMPCDSINSSSKVVSGVMTPDVPGALMIVVLASPVSVLVPPVMM